MAQDTIGLYKLCAGNRRAYRAIAGREVWIEGDGADERLVINDRLCNSPHTSEKSVPLAVVRELLSDPGRVADENRRQQNAQLPDRATIVELVGARFGQHEGRFSIRSRIKDVVDFVLDAAGAREPST